MFVLCEVAPLLPGLEVSVDEIAHSIAAGFGATPSDLVALFKLDGTATMKELAQRMGCDGSFVTAVADALERHGFARREPGERDRRVKNLVLTAEGVAARDGGPVGGSRSGCPGGGRSWYCCRRRACRRPRPPQAGAPA
jgi:hypothetical protein